MSITDAILILFLGLGAVAGFKRGFFSQTISFVGLVLVLVLAFLFKDIVADFLVKYLPVLSFGPFKDAQVLSILLYQFIGFLIVFGILAGILRFILTITNLFELVLKFTVILGVPSKILGALVGVLEAYIIAFLVLLVLNQPMFHLTEVHHSNVGNFILNHTPIVSNISEKTVSTINEIYTLSKYYEEHKIDEFNQKALEVMLENKVLKKDLAKWLVDHKKLTFAGAEKIIEKY